MWRYVLPRIGPARLKRYLDNIPPGVVVEVTELTDADMRASIKTDWGLSRHAYSDALDFGYEFRTEKGTWIPETDPRALRWLAKVRAELAAGRKPRHVGDYGKPIDLQTAEMILRRNQSHATASPRRDSRANHSGH